MHFAGKSCIMPLYPANTPRPAASVPLPARHIPQKRVIPMLLYLLSFLISAALLGADQWTKFWVENHMALEEIRPLFPPVLELHAVHNYGAAWSLFSGARWVLVGVTGAMMLAVAAVLLLRLVRHPLGVFAAFLILSGGTGNLLDRIVQGYVVDMLRFPFWTSYPTFNVADVCVVTGCVLWLLYVLLIREDGEKAPEAAGDSGAVPAENGGGTDGAVEPDSPSDRRAEKDRAVGVGVAESTDAADSAGAAVPEDEAVPPAESVPEGDTAGEKRVSETVAPSGGEVENSHPAGSPSVDTTPAETVPVETVPAETVPVEKKPTYGISGGSPWKGHMDDGGDPEDSDSAESFFGGTPFRMSPRRGDSRVWP